MNDTSQGSWLSRLFIGVGAIGMLLVLVCAMIAPVFGPWFERRKIQENAIYPDCEQRVAAEMAVVYVFLWLIAIVAWAIAIACNA